MAGSTAPMKRSHDRASIALEGACREEWDALNMSLHLMIVAALLFPAQHRTKDASDGDQLVRSKPMSSVDPPYHDTLFYHGQLPEFF